MSMLIRDHIPYREFRFQYFIQFSSRFRVIGCGWGLGMDIDGMCCSPLQGPAFFPFGLSGFCQAFEFPLLWMSLGLFSFWVAPLGPSLLSPSPGLWEQSYSLFSWDFFQKLVLLFHSRMCLEDQ